MESQENQWDQMEVNWKVNKVWWKFLIRIQIRGLPFKALSNP